MNVLINLTVVIILQYTCTSHCHVVHLQLKMNIIFLNVIFQLYLNKASEEMEKPPKVKEQRQPVSMVILNLSEGNGEKIRT